MGKLTGNRDHAQSPIHEREAFHTILRRERRRCDRDGSTFALAVFVPSGAGANGGMKVIAGKIQEEMRSIDEIGWLDWQKLGVLLPVTDLAGGRMFSRRVLETIPAHVPSIVWDVYVYPSPRAKRNGGTRVHHAGHGAHREGRPDPDWRPADLLGEMFSRGIPAWKRLTDCIGSAVLIVLFSPVFLLLSIYIKMVSPGKVLFRQERVGYRGKLFTFLKFRTMQENIDQDTHRDYLRKLIHGGKPMEKLDAGDDPRIIPGGRIIRKASLDELPQLFNVLRGDMSLVGPRPCIPYEAEEYRRWHTHRFDVLPGMTGLWQVSGKNELSFEQMIRLDIRYTDRVSFLIDLKILLLTMPTVLGLVFKAGVQRIRTKLDNPDGAFAAKSTEGGPLIHA